MCRVRDLTGTVPNLQMDRREFMVGPTPIQNLSTRTMMIVPRRVPPGKSATRKECHQERVPLDELASRVQDGSTRACERISADAKSVDNDEGCARNLLQFTVCKELVAVHRVQGTCCSSACTRNLLQFIVCKCIYTQYVYAREDIGN
ncbi:hypothetical protein PUN28_016233 [Cardiocondyla obscurior]|uniref:Uncharacterized protein n=1 Tax=Cardiocondyla obscurior TaxID=286306 RepID=A0AAW2EVA9_9HYME